MTANDFIFSNKIVYEKERYLDPHLKGTKSICCQLTNCTGSKICFYYSNKMILQPFDITINVSSPYISPEEYNARDPNSFFILIYRG